MGAHLDRKTIEALEPLLVPLRSGRHLRLVARPNAVDTDGPGGLEPVEMSWTPEQHDQARELLTTPLRWPDGCTARCVGGAVVLQRPPDGRRTVEDLAEDGCVSDLAGRFLLASLQMGRNIVVTGAWSGAVELITGLLGGARRPSVVGQPEDAVPGGWALLREVDEARAMGADRIGVWSLSPAELAPVLLEASGVVAWLDGGRLDRALMRLEGAMARAWNHASGALGITAGVDLIVVMTRSGRARVVEIAEVVVEEESYRPRLLFASNISSVATALVPVGPPTYVGLLETGGHRVLADELRVAVTGGASQTAAPASGPVPPQSVPPQSVPPTWPAVQPVVEPSPALERELMFGAMENAPPPGWEIDQLSEQQLGPQAEGTSSATDATLAASFGLGPPPAPPGVQPISSDFAVGLAEGGTFGDALKRAQARDAAFRQDDEDDEN